MPNQSKKKQEFPVLMLPARISWRRRGLKAKVQPLLCEEMDLTKKSLALWRRLPVSYDGI
jgi:hypothetical protein